MPSKIDVAKRRLVSLLRDLGKIYEVQVVVTRESPPEEVNRAFRSVARKVHPDKPGGSTKDFRALSAKHDDWADLQRVERPLGRPPRVRPLGSKDKKQGAVVLPVSSSAEQRRELRITARAVLLTYQGFTADLPGFAGLAAVRSVCQAEQEGLGLEPLDSHARNQPGRKAPHSFDGGLFPGD